MYWRPDPFIPNGKIQRLNQWLAAKNTLSEHANQLSGGQQQRVAIARAIASNPAVVLADEPTANVDSETAEKLLSIMEKLNQERGVTFLFSTHDPRVMRRARRIVSLVDGRVARDESGESESSDE